MDIIVKERVEKKNLISEAWRRCRSIHGGLRKSLSMSPTSHQKSKSWHGTTTITTSSAKSLVAPQGCFAVYVGPEKQRFVIKTMYTNHPLFKMLLEDAALEYGYNSEGPILLPCDVHFFYNVLAEMDSKDEQMSGRGCGFSYASFSPFNPSLRSGGSEMGEGSGSYGLLTPSR